MKLCVGDLECETGVCCEAGTCSGTCADRATPQITAVDSDGDVDGAVGHAGHQLGTRLIIDGTNLAGATAYLTGAGLSDQPLLACASSNSRLEVELPGSLTTAGSYQLRVANQAGSCNATLPFLEGQAGPTGPQGPQGPQGMQGPAGPTGQPWTIGSGLSLVSETLSADPAFIESTAAGAGFLRLDGGATAQNGSYLLNGSAQMSSIIASDGSFGSLSASGNFTGNAGVYTGGDFRWNVIRCGADNVGAVDFEATVTGSTTVVRQFDDFGASTVGGKIGARINPYNGATPTEFACWFQSASTGNPGATVRADLWKIPLGGGAVVPGPSIMATVSLNGAAVTTAPTQVSTTTFSGGPFNTFDGATGFSYVVEITFPDFSYPTFKANGCTVRWCTDRVAP